MAQRLPRQVKIVKQGHPADGIEFWYKKSAGAYVSMDPRMSTVTPGLVLEGLGTMYRDMDRKARVVLKDAAYEKASAKTKGG